VAQPVLIKEAKRTRAELFGKFRAVTFEQIGGITNQARNHEGKRSRF
jgi:hypothetical protein